MAARDRGRFDTAQAYEKNRAFDGRRERLVAASATPVVLVV